MKLMTAHVVVTVFLVMLLMFVIIIYWVVEIMDRPDG